MKQITKVSTGSGYHYGYHHGRHRGANSSDVLFHRDNDLPARVFIKLIMWFQDGEIHRDYGPACIFEDTDTRFWHMAYYKNGRRHRDDGPAFVSVDYHPIFSSYIADVVTEETPKPVFDEISIGYYRHNNDITGQVNSWLALNSINDDHTMWTDNERLLYKLTFG